MRSQEVANRYALALYRLAAEQDAVDPTENELRAVVNEAQQHGEIARYLEHPLVSRDRKAAFVAKVFPDLSDRMRNLFGLLIRNRRESYLDLVYDGFLAARAEAEKRVPVCVTTAQPLTEGMREQLISTLEKALGRRVQLEERVDSRVLGGARIETDGRVIDGSVRARLNRLRVGLES